MTNWRKDTKRFVRDRNNYKKLHIRVVATFHDFYYSRKNGQIDFSIVVF
jgi:hypothetical protein